MTRRSPSSVPERTSPRAAIGVAYRKSGPSASSATADVTIFMFDAGTRSFPASCEYSVSPRAGSTINTPQRAWRVSGAESSESITYRNAARSSCAGVGAPPGRAQLAIANTIGSRRRQATLRISQSPCASAENLLRGVGHGAGALEVVRRVHAEKEAVPMAEAIDLRRGNHVYAREPTQKLVRRAAAAVKKLGEPFAHPSCVVRTERLEAIG